MGKTTGRLYFVIMAVSVVFTLTFLVWLAMYYINMPIVYESYSTKECVYVDDPDGGYSCDNLPGKFMHRWLR